MKLISFTLLILSTTILMLSHRFHSPIVYSVIFTLTDILAIYFLLEAFREPKTVRAEPTAIDPEFQVTKPKTAVEFIELAREQAMPTAPMPSPPTAAAPTPPLPDPAISFITMKPLPPHESELRFFDDLTKSLAPAPKTLVIGDFHRKQRDASHTLSDHLAYATPIHEIMCTEIIPDFDLIPYAGKISLELSYRASNFLAAQLQNYTRIIFLLPPDLVDGWKIAAENVPGSSFDPRGVALPDIFQL
jgi:hypothetical protein